MAAGLLFGSTMVLRRKFDAEAALAAIEEHRAGAVVAVPVMLQRILQLPPETRARYDTGSLRMVISAAAPLGADLANRFMDAFGDMLYDIYGTTEAGLAALATPADLRAAPGTVGRPPYGTTVRVLGADRAEVVTGQPGHLFVGGGSVFDGYSDGRTKETVGNLINTGDLAHFDDDGRLFIDGREDDMIVSGGENVFPQEVEDVLASHPAVAEVAVIGVPDSEFGQRLAAYVVQRPPAGASAAELKEHVKANLEPFKAPREIVFLDELPRNSRRQGDAAIARRRGSQEQPARAAVGRGRCAAARVMMVREWLRPTPIAGSGLPSRRATAGSRARSVLPRRARGWRWVRKPSKLASARGTYGRRWRTSPKSRSRGRMRSGRRPDPRGSRSQTAA